MASEGSLPDRYTHFSAQTDFPPDRNNLEGLITITAEWEGDRWFFGPKRCQHTETWYVTADANTYDIVANLLPDSPRRSNGRRSRSRNGQVDALPHYFTVHTESALDGDVEEVKVIRWSEANLIPWNETTRIPGLMTGSQERELGNKNDNTHLALGLTQTIVDCTHGTRFSRVLFPCYKQYKRIGTSWQWVKGYWMNRRAENWWDADKSVSEFRKALYKQIWQGKVVWRFRSAKKMTIPLRLRSWHMEDSPG